ncbi:MAG: HNH endonuclease, partial [Actinomycetota bacterium]
GGQRLASESVRRLACDGRIEWVLESGGRPVGIGRRGRAVPGQVLRVLRHRDGAACRFPGCERRRWLKAHHLVHWAKGGATDLDNLVLLCHAHHRLIHEGGWRTSGHPARDLRFHDPRGQPLRTMPGGLARGVRERLLT